MAENPEGTVVEFNPLQTPVQNNDIQIGFRDFVKYLTDGYYEKDIQKQFHDLSDGITGLNNKLEKELFRVQNALVANPSNTIRTLPLLAGREVECISTVQPAAWISGVVGGMYDPVKDFICLNCVGHWEGKARSLNHYLWKSITTPCFCAFHLIALISIILGILFAYLNPNIKNNSLSEIKSIIIVSVISVSYDLGCVIILLMLETFSPDDPAPFEASQVQEQVHQVINSAIECIAVEISDEHKSLATNEMEMKNPQLVGHFVMVFFYETGKTVLANLLKPTGIFSEKNIQTIEWPEFERFLSLFRFLREFSDAEILTYEPIPDLTRKKFFKALIVALERGQPEVHFQLLRLLALALEPPNIRMQHVEKDKHDINMNHYLTTNSVRSLVHDLKIDLIKWKASKNPLSYGSIENQARIEVIVAKSSDEQLVTFRSHASRFSSTYTELG